MRVMHVTNAYPSEAKPIKGIFIKEQIELLERSGLEVDVYVIPEGRGWRKYARAWWDLMRRASSYDVVHAHHVFCGLICILAGQRNRLVLSFLNDVGRNIIGVNTRISSFFEQIVHRLSKAAIFKSPKFINCMKEGDRLIPNSVTLKLIYDDELRESVRGKLGFRKEDCVLLFVSANDLHRKSKRYDRFVEVLEAVQSRAVSAKQLLMVNVPRDDVADYFNSADFLVVVSEFEGSPNSVKEALASGLRVISTNVGDVDLLCKGVPGCAVFDNFDVANFAARIVSEFAISRNREDLQQVALLNLPSDSSALKSLREVYDGVCGDA
mgnify:FL=1